MRESYKPDWIWKTDQDFTREINRTTMFEH